VQHFVVHSHDAHLNEGIERMCGQQAAEVLGSAPELVFSGPDRDEPIPDVVPGHAVAHVWAERVIDPRIYGAAFSTQGPVWVGEKGIDEEDSEPVVVGLRITSEAILNSSLEALGGPAEEVLLVGDLDPYIPNLRRRLRPYWTPTENEAGRALAASMLLDATQKGVLDFPARYLHPPPENFLVRLFSPSPITPNQITIFTGIIGFWATWLFAMQDYTPAILIALLVNVLDGVDGKLARVKLLASRFGDRLDHILDILFEFSWYLGIGWGLSGGGMEGRPFRLGAGLILIMLGARAVSGVYKLVSGRQIHDHRAFDRAFRLIAGRRNIYVMILVTGLLLGQFPAAFTLCFAWGLGTLAVYSVRTAVEATGLVGGVEEGGQ
jgi:phosphatidylglycerophosphate synthase